MPKSTDEIRSRILDLRKAGKSLRQVAEQLNQEGMKTFQGKPFDRQRVMNYLYIKKDKPTRTRSVPAAPYREDYLALRSIAKSPLSDDRLGRMVRAFFNAG